MSWYKGSAHDPIAFDAVVDAVTLNSELYTTNPDRSSPFCVTCDSGIRKGFVGQPAWHPDGEHIEQSASGPLHRDMPRFTRTSTPTAQS